MDKPKEACFTRDIYLDDLRPGDILVFEDQARGLWGALKQWALGKTYGHSWGHVAVYVGAGEIIESVGRGVCENDLTGGRLTAVLRHSCYNADMGARLVAEAKRVKNAGGSWYDYFCIPRYVIPRLLFHK
jgi:cell wall-associated NlpC family hydrolase